MGSTIASHSACKQWEEKQNRLHGCKYVDGICVEHGSDRIALEPQPLCACRSFPHPHELEEHDTRPRWFADATELRRFEDAAATDWRSLAERQPQREQLQLIDKSLPSNR